VVDSIPTIQETHVAKITLKEYQKTAARTLVNHQRYILGDAPGIGKTFPAIYAADRVHRTTHPKLVVVPSYLMLQWRDVIHACLGPDEPVLVVQRKDPCVSTDYTGWVIINYNTLMNAGIQKHPELIKIPWGVVIFDEAHRLRGRGNQWTKNTRHLKCDFLWMLTGTPLVNNPGDIWTLLNIMDKQNFRSYWKFVDAWCVLETTPWTTVVRGIKPGLEPAFYQMLHPQYMLRRTFDDAEVRAEVSLDDPIHIPVPVELNKSALKAHHKALKEWRLENPEMTNEVVMTSGGGLVIALRKLTGGISDVIKAPEKQDTVVQIVDDHRDESHVVFTWFRDTAHALGERIKALDIPTYVIDGSMSPQKREAAIAAWKQENVGVIVATMASMQEGVNLQKSSSVIFAEHHYLPATIDQAIARCRRMGQDKPVIVRHVIAEGTVDASVWNVMHNRHTNVQRALLEDLLLELESAA
jgi:SNF2 family DNA or RNA helicase